MCEITSTTCFRHSLNLQIQIHDEFILDKYPKIGLSLKKIINPSLDPENNNHNNHNNPNNTQWGIDFKSMDYTLEQKLEIIWHIYNEITPPITSGKYSTTNIESISVQRKIFRCAEFGVVSSIFPNQPMSFEEYNELLDLAIQTYS